MERNVALRRLQKRFGKRFGWRENKGYRPADERATARERGHELRRAVDQISEEMKRLREELLRDPVYQNLMARYKELKAEQDQAFSISHVKRFDVGTLDDLGFGGVFHVLASGDSWEEVFRELKKRDNPQQQQTKAAATNA